MKLGKISKKCEKFAKTGNTTCLFGPERLFDSLEYKIATNLRVYVTFFILILTVAIRSPLLRALRTSPNMDTMT